MYRKNMEISRTDDVYLMEAVKDNVVINYGYRGIEVLDCNLKTIKIVKIFDDIVIHSIYVNSKNNELLLLCPENECFVYVNLNDYSTKIILFEDNLENTFFSTIYLWEEDIVLINLYESFAKINLKNKSIEIIKDKKVAKIYPAFYKFCSPISGKGMLDVYSSNNRSILQNSNGEFFMYGLKGDFNKLSMKNTYEITDFAFNDENVGVVYDNCVKIIKNSNEEAINCDEGDVFLKAAYLENKNLVVLSNNRLKPMKSKVIMFNI